MNRQWAPPAQPEADVRRLSGKAATRAPERSAAGEPDAGRITVMICGDNRLLTGALASVVRQSGDIELAGDPVESARDAVAVVEELRPDVVLVALRPGGPVDPIEVTDRIIEHASEASVLLMTHERSDLRLYEAIEAGASGVIHDANDVDDLLTAVRRAARGDVLVDPKRLPQLARRAALERRRRAEVERRLGTLTEREREILALLRRGLRNDRIGQLLYISPRTVETHVQHVMRKLGVHSKLEAAAFGVHDDAVAD